MVFHGWKVVGCAFLIAVFGGGFGFYGIGVLLAIYPFGPGILGWLRDAAGSYAAPLVACLALPAGGRGHPARGKAGGAGRDRGAGRLADRRRGHPRVGSRRARGTLIH
jgi:hypothetical protein